MSVHMRGVCTTATAQAVVPHEHGDGDLLAYSDDVQAHELPAWPDGNGALGEGAPNEAGVGSRLSATSSARLPSAPDWAINSVKRTEHGVSHGCTARHVLTIFGVGGGTRRQLTDTCCALPLPSAAILSFVLGTAYARQRVRR